MKPIICQNELEHLASEKAVVGSIFGGRLKIFVDAVMMNLRVSSKIKFGSNAKSLALKEIRDGKL